MQAYVRHKNKTHVQDNDDNNSAVYREVEYNDTTVGIVHRAVNVTTEKPRDDGQTLLQLDWSGSLIYYGNNVDGGAVV